MTPRADPPEGVLNLDGSGDKNEEADLLMVRIGSFSGSAISLRDALGRRVRVIDFDLLPRLSGMRGAPARVAASVERLRARTRVSPMKTEAWSRAAQRTATSALSEARGAVLFVQTIPAFDLSGVHYGIYTDRVAREGASSGGRFASRFTPNWLKREEIFLRGAHRVYVMGSTTRDWLLGEYGLPSERVRVVGAGPNAAPGSPIRSQRCRRFLFVGTQWELKGGPELLAAFQSARHHVGEAELLLVGSTPSEALPPGVRALGRIPVSQMRDIYSEVDALVIPTHSEAFGIALLEALARGIPCIATTVGNQPQIVGEAGICVAPGDIPALSNAMTRLATEYEAYRHAARHRLRQLASQMNWERIARRISDDLLAMRSGTGDRPVKERSRG
jgi:glycosyltransferase involved in cell wall biosynthesis